MSIVDKQWWLRFSIGYYMRMRRYAKRWQRHRDSVQHPAWAKWLVTGEGKNPWPI